MADDDAKIGEASHDVTGAAALFNELCDRALRFGLLVGNHETDDDRPTVRGSIDLSEQLRRRPRLELPLAVRYAEHDEDGLKNPLRVACGTAIGPGADSHRPSPSRDAPHR